MNGSDDENEGANANMVGVGTPPPILVDGQQQPDKPLTVRGQYFKGRIYVFYFNPDFYTFSFLHEGIFFITNDFSIFI